MTTPRRIAVLIPAYNAEKIIHKALASLRRNAEPHDVIVIDDGSKLPLSDYISAQDNLVILRAPHNLGITGALNFGLKYILQRSYDYVARLDADDEAAPDRLKKQREFLDAHPEIGVVGSWGRVVSEQGQELFCLNHPVDHGAILKALFYNSCFLHPSLMLRASLLRETGGYSENYPSAEDYELVRRLGKHARLANLPEYLINYTSSADGISQQRRKEQLHSRLRIQWQHRDPMAPDFYIGMAKTLALWFMPQTAITALKQKLGTYRRQ